MRIGQFMYTGNGELLEKNIEYTFYENGAEIEAYPEGSAEPVTMNRGVFASLQRGNLDQVDGYTPMR